MSGPLPPKDAGLGALVAQALDRLVVVERRLADLEVGQVRARRKIVRQASDSPEVARRSSLVRHAQARGLTFTDTFMTARGTFSRASDLEIELASLGHRASQLSGGIGSEAGGEATINFSESPWTRPAWGAPEADGAEPADEKDHANFSDSPDSKGNLRRSCVTFSNTNSTDFTKQSEKFMDQLNDKEISTSAVMFSETVWEVCFLFNLDVLSKSNAVLIGFSLVLNLLIQTVFCVCLQSRMVDQDDSDPDDFEQWRFRTGQHADKVEPSTWTSMTSRLCGDDMSLPISAVQASALKDISQYTSNIGPNVYLPFSGPTLLAVAVCVWCMVVLKEGRSAIHFLRYMLSLPRGPRTHLSPNVDDVDGFTFEISVLSYGRLTGMVVVTLCRLAIALALLVLGSQWLAGTSKISDVVLNAVAMMFVMDVDELLFAIGLAQPTRLLYQSLRRRPLQLRLVWGVDYPPIVNYFICCGLVLWILVENRQVVKEMGNTHRVLCNGNRDFAIVQHNPSGLLYSTPTTPYFGNDKNMSSNMNVFWAEAVQELIDGVTPPTKSVFVEDAALFNTLRWETMSDRMVRIGTCEDFNPNSTGANATIMTLQRQLNTMSESTCEGWASILDINGQSKCANYTSVLLRATCPVTCGCRSPRAGLLLSGESLGCPTRVCEEDAAFQRELAKLECEDMSLDELRESHGWTSLLAQLDYFNWADAGGPNFDNITQDFDKEGCDALREYEDKKSENYRRLLCYHSSEHTTLHSFCPVACGCREYGGTLCPQSCESAPAGMPVASDGRTRLSSSHVL